MVVETVVLEKMEKDGLQQLMRLSLHLANLSKSSTKKKSFNLTGQELNKLLLRQ